MAANKIVLLSLCMVWSPWRNIPGSGSLARVPKVIRSEYDFQQVENCQPHNRNKMAGTVNFRGAARGRTE